MTVLTQMAVRDGDLLVNRVQDVEPILENNRRLQTETQSRRSSFRHIASVPNVIIEKWLNEERARGNTTIRWGSRELDELMARKLRDSEWAYLRTDRKQVFI